MSEMETEMTTDRQLLAAAHRWARTHGWSVGHMGWDNGTTRVEWDNDMVRIWRKSGQYWPICSDPYPVDSVRQGVDVLCALGILPAGLSSAYWAGMELIGYWLPFPMGSYAQYLREFATAEGVS